MDLAEQFYKEKKSIMTCGKIMDNKKTADTLTNALHDLHAAMDEARGEGFAIPSEMALENAKHLLREMYLILPRRFEVYPTPDGEIAIDAPGGHGRSVLLLCDSEGGALCLVNKNGSHRRARYSTTNTLPDRFVRDALTDLYQLGP